MRRPTATTPATGAYDDAADTRTDTNPNSHSTVSSFDRMGRLTGVKRADGSSRALQYDYNGNLTQETDFSGNVTKYVYDDANRRIETDAPEGKVVLTQYDALGHVTQETVQASDGSDARVTQYQYAHPLYKRTLVQRELDAGTSADEATQYDNNGNPTQITDAVGRITKRIYDARDRLTEEDAPYGKTTTFVYDAADRKQSQTIKNPGHADETTGYEYDNANRPTATTDAVGDHRTMGYDNTKNVTSRSDARGNLTQYAYDGRDELTQETGPETGQTTAYAYDLNGNRVTETWANGNVRTSAYDALERRTGTTDTIGTVEGLTYAPDDEIATRTDANGHVTTNHYDGLHRLKKQDLPPISGQARQIVKTFDVHGDALTEKDPGGHVTSHTYDALGRLATTTLPDVSGEPTATLHFAYDLTGRPTSQTDARGNVTTIAYDDGAHTKTQTDPATPDGSFTQVWTYDALGNEVSHTDRRGIVTATGYDADNRIVTITRDRLTTSTRAYAGGLLESDMDANGNKTSYQYDKAERKIEEDRPLSFKRTWAYTPMGDVATATDADGRKTTNTYTPRRFLETQSNNAGETTTYGYDGEGHRTSMQRPMGTTYAWSYTYDEGDRLIEVDDAFGATHFGYDLDGNKTSQTDASGNQTTYMYDARHHRRSVTYPAITSGAATGQAGPVR
jgi:YD repeat-containing protein